MNNTRVIPARINLNKDSGGRIEILFNRKINQDSIEVIFFSSRKPMINSYLVLDGEKFFKVLDINKNYLMLLKLSKDNIFSIFEKYGEIPLPPYIRRKPNNDDKNFYQTIFAKKNGSVAAPTAALHFDEIILKKLKDKGVKFASVTLHIGMGTFTTIKSKDIDNL